MYLRAREVGDGDVPHFSIPRVWRWEISIDRTIAAGEVTAILFRVADRAAQDAHRPLAQPAAVRLENARIVVSLFTRLPVYWARKASVDREAKSGVDRTDAIGRPWPPLPDDPCTAVARR